MSERLGVVAIGRNEGERLEHCLRSLAGRADAVLYVDSGSSDGSDERARAMGVEVVQLDPSTPFSAARARNEGFERLCELIPDVELVQFVDGDCELAPRWLESAAPYLHEHPDIAVVCGQRRELHPEESRYNKITDMGWRGALGETHTCGGDAMIRADTFRDVGGYDAGLIAGEDPELCLRIRRSGKRIVRLGQEMTLHDAAIHTFWQWWRRQARSGHAYAEILYLQGGQPERHWLRTLGSIVFWGGLLPIFVAVAVWGIGAFGFGLLLAYGVLWLRTYRGAARRSSAKNDRALYASACLVGKFAELQGVLTFVWNRLVHRRGTPLMEYKNARLPPDHDG